jgi:SAM-dependent methyltransferase
MSSWDSNEKWYDRIVGEQGHEYHQDLILPQLISFSQHLSIHSILDVGCGQGVLERALRPFIDRYVGIDISSKLIQRAKQRAVSSAQYYCTPAEKGYPFRAKPFDAAYFLLSLQNMEHPEEALKQAISHIRPSGYLLLVLNHPCFRIPRQSDWGFDPKQQLQYRRMSLYMSPQAIPIQTHPSQSHRSSITYSYHYPLSTYMKWLSHSGCSLTHLDEWCSCKTSSGQAATRENRARKEFPLFLFMVAQVVRPPPIAK